MNGDEINSERHEGSTQVRTNHEQQVGSTKDWVREPQEEIELC